MCRSGDGVDRPTLRLSDAVEAALWALSAASRGAMSGLEAGFAEGSGLRGLWAAEGEIGGGLWGAFDRWMGVERLLWDAERSGGKKDGGGTAVEGPLAR